ncbi:MAG: hypothetical protein WC829_02330 [Hyphomicrobium sp.]|jgi:hypothetical protein
MAILTFSEDLLAVSQVDFSLVSLTAHSPQSALNQFSITDGPVTEFWQATMTIVPRTEANWRALRALLFRARSGQNVFRVHDPSSASYRGAGASSPTVNIAVSAVAGDETVTLKNLTASQAISLAADDKIGIGENLYSVMADSGSNVSGQTSVSILPALRLGVAVDDAVNLVKPTGLFRLMSKPSVVIVPGMISQPVQLELMEDPDVDA